MRDVDSQRLLQELFERALDAIVVSDERGRIVAANAAVEKLLGRAPQTLIGESIETLVPERHREHARLRSEYLTQATARPMGRGILLFARHAAGHDIPVDISLTPLRIDGRRLVASALRDLRGRAHSLETLRVQATALRSAANGVVITDRTGVITWVNPSACAITGYSAGELVGRHTRILKSGRHGPEFYAALWQRITHGETWSGTIVNRRKDGSLYDEEQTIAPVLDEGGSLTHFIAIKQDVTEKHRLQQDLALAHTELAVRLREIEELNRELRERAIRDPLTQLHNRRYFDEAIESEVSRVVRSGEALSLAILDVDRFKRVNDAFGHAMGDRVLQRLADLLRAQARRSDLVCRFGGEEFVVVMLGAELDTALTRAESWRDAFAAQPTAGDDGIAVPSTVSIGVAQYRPGQESIDRTLARADAALYAAKQRGRNRVETVDAPVPGT